MKTRDARMICFFEANRKRPFQWGQWDCFILAYQFARDVLRMDLPEEFKGWKLGGWRSPGAKRRGAQTLEDFLGTYFSQVPLASRISGDILLMDTDGDGVGDSLAVFIGNHKAVTVVEKKRLGTLPLELDRVKGVYRG